jgi:glycosyltransferase involved in cell wall biosynthesis
VIVPAANEEHRIGKCLSSIAAAAASLHRSHLNVSVQVIVVLDRCQDATAGIARAAGAVLVTIAAGSVGAARRAGATAALDSSGRASELWLASTDADSDVPADWLTGMAAEAQRGTHLMLGTVLPEPGLLAASRAEWLHRHHLRDDHPHVHGANLGIRGDSYLALGGWQLLRTGEDVELAARAARSGHLRISRTATLPVITSVRQIGRAPRGFSSYLRALDSADHQNPGTGHLQRVTNHTDNSPVIREGLLGKLSGQGELARHHGEFPV